MAEAAIASAHPLAPADIDMTMNCEPRVRDLRLAEALGMANPHAIRRIIQRHRDALETLGQIISHDDAKSGAGRPSSSYYLTKKQALYVTAKADTPSAAMVTVQMVEVFDAVTSGRPLGAQTPTLPPAPAGHVYVALNTPEQMMLAGYRAAVDAEVKRQLSARRFEMGATASIAVSQILAGTLTYDTGTKRFTQRDAAKGGST